MTTTPVMRSILSAMLDKGELPVEAMARVTRDALLDRKLIEDCPRLYFGPRSERYRLTETGRALVLTARSKGFWKGIQKAAAPSRNAPDWAKAGINLNPQNFETSKP